MREPNDTVFQKTLALSDFYFGADDWDYPLGLIQMMGESAIATRSAARRCRLAGVAARHAVRARSRATRWISGCRAEDLPRPDNRIRITRTAACISN